MDAELNLFCIEIPGNGERWERYVALSGDHRDITVEIPGNGSCITIEPGVHTYTIRYLGTVRIVPSEREAQFQLSSNS